MLGKRAWGWNAMQVEAAARAADRTKFRIIMICSLNVFFFNDTVQMKDDRDELVGLLTRDSVESTAVNVSAAKHEVCRQSLESLCFSFFQPEDDAR
mmetsp:Transcript_10482/g.22853  ORF Transcript_10482/g.22853 Transcript_10482/m.22853 type:complete len:96 (-) Transcript_10482:27-314(-)